MVQAPPSDAPTWPGRSLVVRPTPIVGVWERDLAAGVWRWSPSLWELMGLEPRGEAPPLDEWRRWVGPDEQARLREACRRALAGGGQELTIRVVPPDGRPRMLRVRLLRASATNAHLLSGVVEDVTLTLQSERASLTALQMFHAAIEVIPEALVIRDDAGGPLWYNQAYRELFGRSEPEIAASRLDAFIEPDELPALRAWHAAIRETGQVPVAPVLSALRPDGSVRYWEPVPGQDVVVEGRRVGRILVGRDVTDRVLLERSLAERSADFEAIFEAAPRGMVVIDEAGRILRSNAAAKATFRWGDDLDGQHVGVLAYDVPEELHDHYLQHYLRHGTASTPEGLVVGRQREVRGRRRDGTSFPALLTVASLPSLGEGGRRFLGVVADLTERQAREEQVRILQKNDALGTLVAGVAHDFNNLLTAIIGSLHMAREGRGGDLMHWLGIATRGADQAALLVRQLLEFARPGTAAAGPVDFTLVAGETVRLLRETGDRRVAFVLECAPGVATVHATPSAAQQILMNLLMNARDAALERIEAGPSGGTDTGGRVRVTVQPAPGDPSHVLVRVEDNGVGVPEEIRDRLFDPFFTTKPPGRGTGLGLSTVLTLVRQLGGSVRCDAAAEGGARFDVLLPASEAIRPEAAPADEPLRLAPHLAGARALLVDDHEDVRAFAHAVLESAGADVTVASSAVEALTLVAPLAPEVVIFDINMPGMTGWEFLEEVRRISPQTRLVVLSGYLDPALVERHRPDAAIQKPCTPDQLIAAASGRS